MSTRELPHEVAHLAAAASAAMGHAYAPYSHFRVGAALRATTGQVFAGCNVENAAYPAGLCAVRAAVAAAVAAGHRQFDLIVVTTESEAPTPPCGMCRQVLTEFAPDLQVISVTADGIVRRWALRDLLPDPFHASSLSPA